jgi:two-component system LytT family sensor kinase
MTTLDRPRWIWWRLSLPPIIHLFGDLSGYLIFPDVVKSHYTGGEWIVMYLKEFFIITLGLYIVSEGNVFAYRWLDSRYPWEASPRRRLTLQLLFAFIWIIPSAGLIALALALFGFQELSRETTVNMMIMSLIVTVGAVVIFFFQKMKSSFLETERLKQETEIAQDHALRQQTDPHFLFNSFNTLTSIIMEDPNLAVQYVGRLSKVYRYVLQSKEHPLVALREEINFLNDFAFGFTLRFEDNFSLVIEIPEKYFETRIPPLTLQILAENCVKHNIISKEKPLKISIGIDGDNIIVRNTIQRKPPENAPTGFGLKNIISRYSLVSRAPVVIDESGMEFIVRLPLLWKEDMP